VKKLDVEITSSAVADLVNIDEWLHEIEGAAKAHKVIEQLFACIETLERYPMRGSTVPELTDITILGYRQIVKVSYRIIYRVSGMNVYVLAIFHQRRDLSSALLGRLV